MSTAISGLNTTLYCGDSATALTKLCDIKDVPDLISEPNLLDATTLSDPMQVNIFGIIQSDTKSFTANYNKTDYKKVKKLATMRLPRATPEVLRPEDAGRLRLHLAGYASGWSVRLWRGRGCGNDHQLHLHQEA